VIGLTQATNGVTRSDPEVIRLAVQRLVEAARPRKIILFGSFARGEQNPDSDLDFVVVLPSVDNHFREMVRLRRVLKDIRIPIDVLVYSEEEVRTRGDWSGTALHEALHSGRVLYASG
jgi:predicted nucleotidyltransferase